MCNELRRKCSRLVEFGTGLPDFLYIPPSYVAHGLDPQPATDHWLLSLRSLASRPRLKPGTAQAVPGFFLAAGY